MAEFINRLGDKYVTNQGYEIEIIEYFGNKNCTIEIKMPILYRKNKVCFSDVRNGKIYYPYHKAVCGVGYMGEGKYNSNCISYYYWKDMLTRCYNEKGLKKFSSYKRCSVDKRWHNFQNFAQWFEENYNPDIMDSWHLDKDIIMKNNKVYSPETCCFVPVEINVLFIKRHAKRENLPIGVYKKGNRYIARMSKKNRVASYIGSFLTPEEAFIAYKITKENYIKEVSNVWKNKIDDKTYQALINYKVEITD